MKTLIVTAKAIYKDGHLIFHNKEDIPEDGTEVTVNFEKWSKTSAILLRGSWSKYFPAAIDIDEELQHLREGWQQEPESSIERGDP